MTSTARSGPRTETRRGRLRAPLLLAIDGRSGAGKTSLAVETAAVLRPHLEVAVFHLDSVYPGWDGLAASLDTYTHDVVAPLAQGRTARWTWWDWTADAPGRADATPPADVVILEGVGAGNRNARPHLDAVAWVAMDDSERQRRALRRDGATFAAHWDRWAAQEDAYLAGDEVAEAAWLTLDGHGPTPRAAADLVEGLRSLPGWESALALVPAPGPARWERRTLSTAAEPRALFAATGGPDAATALLLESSDRDVTPSPERSRYSLIGLATGSSTVANHTDGVTIVSSGLLTLRRVGPFFPWLATVWPGGPGTGHAGTGHDAGPAGLGAPGTSGCPGDPVGPFQPGWMGWIGYGIKREAGSRDGAATLATADGRASPTVPEALLFRPGRGASVDHVAGTTTLFWSADDPGGPEWADRVAGGLPDESPGRHSAERAEGLPAERSEGQAAASPAAPPVFTVRDTREHYLAKIRAAQHQIHEGNTYEVCLTTALESTVDSFDGWATYRRLAEANRAPFTLYLRAHVAGTGVGRGAGTGNGSQAGNEPVQILSTSPERFLAVSSRAEGDWLVTEPIKGTRPRGATPDEDRALAEELASSPKDRAENIMITDLARNDLSRFARPGTLATTRVCAIESYPTVHQMVSTVTAQLQPGVPRADALAAAFPPGSMTGAPKISTMDILEDLEAGPRGVYSGVAGYLSADGAADLNVLIRTLVAVPVAPAIPAMSGGPAGATEPVESAGPSSTAGASGRTHLSLGVGGAITADSVPEEEWDEVRTKAHGVLRVLGSAFPDA
ncbi:chorismate-binding protein [Citricoccus sp.]|uniref:chorismate-binding protein n=1 Tax=Citricoccus sp. TaxID=1978372 RepID=UPI0028BEEEF5|nr:chorismate-binding protein [Citricoccus sp.]